MYLEMNKFGTTRTAEVETQEDKIIHNGQKNVDSVPLRGTAMADSMVPSPADERTTKKRPAQRIRRGIAEAVELS